MSIASKFGTSPLIRHLMQALWLAVSAEIRRTSLGLLGCKGHLTDNTFSIGDFSIFAVWLFLCVVIYCFFLMFSTYKIDFSSKSKQKLPLDFLQFVIL